VLDSLKKTSSSFLTILCLVCLLAMLSVPVMAQDQTPKEKGTTQATQPPPPAAKPQMAPRMRRMPQAEKSMPAPTANEYKMKGVDDTVGGQEIRSKKGPDDK
jgi:hypothetical protein